MFNKDKNTHEHSSPYEGSEWSWSQRLGEFLGNGRHLGSGYCSNGKMEGNEEKRSIKSPLEILNNLTADINKPHINSTHLSLFFANLHTQHTRPTARSEVFYDLMSYSIKHSNTQQTVSYRSLEVISTTPWIQCTSTFNINTYLNCPQVVNVIVCKWLQCFHTYS